VLDQAGIKLGDIDRFVLHQANPKLIETCAQTLGVPAEKFPLTAVELGNTAVASVPLTLAAAHRSRPLRRAEQIVLASVGGGLSTAAVLITWY
jgi:3-oxoacyl-[acyl-carrier-protein] synthase-3